ncbi:MAG: UDP-glucose 4-epimerase GalE [Acidobacteriota bacterium]
MHILVTGGAGYVGSHLVRALLDEGHTVVVVDDLSSGHRVTLPDGVPLRVGRCGDTAVLDAAAAEAHPDAVMHLAARCSVSESTQDPGLYYRANLGDSLVLLDWMVSRQVGTIVHSSTCAVYGHPGKQPIDEQVPPDPINPYGATKLAVDRAIYFYGQAHGIGGVALRYFNAAGAHPAGDLGEDKTPASNLIPRLLEVALGQAPSAEIYGDDYPTPDGTGVRDYVHVTDLAAAHLAALALLADGHPGGVFNLGTGKGQSVLEVVAAARQVTGRAIPLRIGMRRPGDPPCLVADSRRANRELGWTPRRSELATILNDAWSWRQKHPSGYATVEVCR